jgi:hypothetical protein
MAFIACGVLVIALPIQRAATSCDLGPGGPLFEFVNCSVAAALWLWGCSRLRAAKAKYPDLSWWQFLHDDAIGLGICAVLMAVFLTLSAEQRDSLQRSLREVVELISLVRGRP